MATNQPLSTSNILYRYLGTVSAIFLVFLAIWQAASILPHSKMIRHFFLDENSPVEALALVFLLAAFILTLFTLVRPKTPGLYSLYWWLFPMGIFLLICDETSFGRVYYNWYAPLNICGAKFDALHDALMVLPHCLPQFGISKTTLVLAATLILVVVLTVLSYIILKQKASLVTSLKTNPAWLYLGFAFILFWLGGGLEFIVEIDSFGIHKNGFLIFLEETLESLAEYTILFSAIVFSQKR